MARHPKVRKFNKFLSRDPLTRSAKLACLPCGVRRPVTVSSRRSLCILLLVSPRNNPRAYSNFRAKHEKTNFHYQWDYRFCSFAGVRNVHRCASIEWADPPGQWIKPVSGESRWPEDTNPP